MDFSIDKDLALFYGIMLGDGCLSHTSKNRKIVAISCSLKDDLPFLKRWFIQF
jgi:hypothetical protein